MVWLVDKINRALLLVTPPEEISLDKFLLCVLLCIYIFNLYF